MIEHLRNKMKTLALADAILMPEWEYRYFSYNSKWSDTQEMGSLRDGSGNEWFLWLSGNLAGYKCLSLDDGIMSDIDSVKSTIPSQYKEFLDEPAFAMDKATCIWHLNDSEWVKHGLGVAHLIDVEQISEWTVEEYHSWATEYYETDSDITSLQKLFNNQFSEELAKQLNHTQLKKLHTV